MIVQSLINHSGDKMVLDALELMNSEGVSSLAVVDNQCNVMGNISTADVKVRHHVLDDQARILTGYRALVPHEIQLDSSTESLMLPLSHGNFDR